MSVDKFVEDHMRKLNNIKSMVDKTSGADRETWIKKWYDLVNKTSGADRETWTKKWYDLVKIVADKIRVLHKNNNELN